ncbi:hypothetical protein M9Y10_005357 [Tritrichomonas musculus]|uniref:UBC core domain-containing protein n=1 Tax=Tritrichomonas musculus TaxID=1915356 RepID=A0ABR2JKY1_9EUKA
MSENIIKYSLNKEIENYAVISLPDNSTFQNLLDIVNKDKKNKFNQVLLDDYIVDNEEMIIDYNEPNSIFILKSNQKQRQEISNYVFYLYSNIDFKSMRKPIEVSLQSNASAKEVTEKIREILHNVPYLLSTYNISIYISGGIKLNMNLNEFMEKYQPLKNNLYAVVSPFVDYQKIKNRKELLLPFHLSEKSEFLITSLAEYFHHNGNKSADMINKICCLINFPPLSQIFLSFQQNGINNENLFEMVSIFQTLLLGIDSESKKETVFEDIPYFCQYICNQICDFDLFCEINGQTVFAPDFINTTHFPLIKYWEPPEKLSLYSNNYYFHIFPTNSFIPSPPCFVKDNTLLIESCKDNNYFLNPLTEERIAKKHSLINTFTIKPNHNIDIKPADVKQIIIVLIDKSMNIPANGLEDIQKKILSIYSNCSLKFGNITLYGAILFDTNNYIVSQISQSSDNFLKNIDFNTKNKKCNILNAINYTIDYINSFNWEINKVIFPNAQYRIVLLSSGYNNRIKISINQKSLDNIEKTKPKSNVPKSEKNHYNDNKNCLELNRYFLNPNYYSLSFNPLSLKPKPTINLPQIPLKGKPKKSTVNRLLIKPKSPINTSASNYNSKCILNSLAYPIPNFVMMPISDFKESSSSDKEEKNLFDENSSEFCYIKQKLLESDVVLDALIMQRKAPAIKTIAKLCHYTGGSIVIVDDEELATKTISQEAFLNIEFRQRKKFGDDYSSAVDNEFPNRMKIEALTKPKLISVQQPLPNASNRNTRRIIQEFRYISSLEDKSFAAYMVENNIYQWRVFIKAPPKANLDEKWFYLLVDFPNEYPSKPPKFKFISIPYHINITNEGSICLNYLNKEYNQSLKIAFLIVCIIQLLETPNYESALDMQKKNLYDTDKKKFFQKVSESAKQGKDNIEDWLHELEII